MLVKKYQQIISCLCVLTPMIFLPFWVQAEESEKAVVHESGLYYTIQRGDTLWDLSQHFHDSAWQWPDMWNENGQIPNPHWIYPGERIRLIHKDGVDQYLEANLKTEVAAPIGTPRYYYSLIDHVGFIRKDPIQHLGSIFKVKDDKKMISQGDLVYIRQTGDTAFNPGNKFTVYRTMDPMEDSTSRHKIGIQHYLTGVVEITEVQSRYAVAKVTGSFRAIHVGDQLMPYKRRSPNILFNESKPGLYGKIIVSEEHEEIFGDDAIAFIDKGDLDGVTPGQLYKVYYQESRQIDPNSKEEVTLNPVDFATLIVLHTESDTSTVLITQSEKHVYSGAFIRTPVN